jgi:hypothetical protein
MAPKKPDRPAPPTGFKGSVEGTSYPGPAEDPGPGGPDLAAFGDRFFTRLQQVVSDGVSDSLAAHDQQATANVQAGTGAALSDQQPQTIDNITAGTTAALAQQPPNLDEDSIARAVAKGMLAAIAALGVHLAKLLKPAPPTNLNFSVQRKTAMPKAADVTISWDLSVNTDVESQHLHVEGQQGTDAAVVLYDADISASQNSYLQGAVPEGVTISAAVTATNANGTSDPLTGSITLPSDLGVPQPPTNMSFALSNIQDAPAAGPLKAKK